MKLHVIRTDGTEEHHETTPLRCLADVHRLIGAETLSTVNLRDGRVMLLDDRGYETRPVERPGEFHGRPVTHVVMEPVRALKPDNPKATELYHRVCQPGTTHRIVGDVAIVVDRDLEG